MKYMGMFARKYYGYLDLQQVVWSNCSSLTCRALECIIYLVSEC